MAFDKVVDSAKLDATFTAIADAIREKKGSTAVFTPEQMAEEIEGIVTGDNLPNAEDAYFGSVTESYPSMLSEFRWGEKSNLAKYACHGFRFSPNVTFGLYGFRHFSIAEMNVKTVLLDETNGTIAAELTFSVSGNDEWENFYLPVPINLAVGKTYLLYAHKVTETGGKTNGCTYGFSLSDCEYRSEIGYMATFSGSSAPPSTAEKYNACASDMLIGEAISESAPNEYKVQTETMTAIAEEVRRISDTSGKLSPAQIISELSEVTDPVLQDKTVTPTDTEQVITPDEGYDGLSSVTVEAVEAGGNTPMFRTNVGCIIPEYDEVEAKITFATISVSYTSTVRIETA